MFCYPNIIDSQWVQFLEQILFACWIIKNVNDLVKMSPITLSYQAT